jgi:hypothetical protein
MEIKIVAIGIGFIKCSRNLCLLLIFLHTFLSALNLSWKVLFSHGRFS